MSRAGLAEAVRVASRGPHDRGVVSRPCAAGAVVRLFGSTVGVVYELDDAEVARRAAAQSEATTRLDLLDQLMDLPVSAAVAVDDLSKAQRAMLRRLPSGAVEHDGLSIVRLVVAPIVVRWAVVAARNWRSGLQMAGRFAPYCARSILLPKVPEDWDHAEMRAAFFGVGVIVRAGATVHTLVEPDPYVRRRHTPAQWWFAEETWRQIREPASSVVATFEQPRSPE